MEDTDQKTIPSHVVRVYVKLSLFCLLYAGCLIELISIDRLYPAAVPANTKVPIRHTHSI